MARLLVRWFVLVMVMATFINVAMSCTPKTPPWPEKDPNIKPGTEENPVCNNHQWDPPPKGAICAKQGWIWDGNKNTFKHIITHGTFYGGLFDCWKQCFKKRAHSGDCKIFAWVPGRQCNKYEKIVTGIDNKKTPWKWYEPRCFCNLTKPEW
ncbi:hypothetical protein ACHAPO_007334 [Fusarium lateritium]